MAYLSRSSPGRGRRLSELLEEQQDPFLLDVYLLEKGYSDRIIISQPTTKCWPINECKRLKSLPSHGFMRRRCLLLKCMITKFLNGKVIRKALNWDKYKLLHFSDTGSKNNASGELDGTFQWKCMEVDDSKQLTPESVLELHSNEDSPVHISNKEEDVSTLNLDSPKKDLAIFREMLELAYTCAFNQLSKSKNQFDQPEKLLLECEQDNKRIQDSQQCLVHDQIAERIIHEEDNSWQRQREDLSSISHLMTIPDISNSRGEWYEFQPQVREIGMRIGEAIFEDIREDVILEILGFHCTFDRS